MGDWNLLNQRGGTKAKMNTSFWSRAFASTEFRTALLACGGILACYLLQYFLFPQDPHCEYYDFYYQRKDDPNESTIAHRYKNDQGEWMLMSENPEWKKMTC